MRIKPFQKLLKLYFRQYIPIMAWSPALVQLFKEIKTCITFSPVLARYNPDKPTFLKTDWSAEVMGFILMQPADDEVSTKSMAHLLKSGEFLFDVIKSGARLKAVLLGSRSCNGQERLYHSFVGEDACSRWEISKNRKYLWVTHFYWLCDRKAVR